MIKKIPNKKAHFQVDFFKWVLLGFYFFRTGFFMPTLYKGLVSMYKGSVCIKDQFLRIKDQRK